MRDYLPTVMDVCSHTLEQWASSTEPIKFYGGARCFAFDVAATVLTGVRFDGDKLGERLCMLPAQWWPVAAIITCSRSPDGSSCSGTHACLSQAACMHACQTERLDNYG